MSGTERDQTKKEEIIELILSDKYDAAKTALSLLDRGVVDDDGNTLYHEAVSRQDLQLLRWLLYNYQSTIPPYIPNNTGSTCFHIACANGKTPCFMALWTESKVSPKIWCKNTDTEGHTGLHMACLGGHHEVAREIVSKLKEEVVLKMNTKGQTALHIAAAGGHLSCVRLLVQYKKLINGKDSFGATALHYAVSGGHLSTAKYLMERCKAIATGETTNKMNIVHAAVSSGDFNMLKYIMSKTKERMHVMVTSTEATVLHIAAGLGYEDILEYLLIKPYVYRLVNNPEQNGWTAAHLAALRNRAGCLAILIGYGADIHTPRDKNRMSAYHIMCNNESADMRKTFPYLFDQLDSVRGHRRDKARHKRPRRRRSRSPSTAELRGGETRQNGHAAQKENHSKRREPSLSASDIVRTRMDFTKTNPLAQDSTPGLQQRRFQKNNMALPNNGYVNRISNTSYQMGREDESDDDFHIDDIEQIPETPLKTIQQFNNFRHSTYTPTQSTEDLTSIGLKSPKVVESASQEPESQTSGLSLPVIVDYSKENRDADVTIYFHNGKLNTVKVKTTTNDSPRSLGSSTGESVSSAEVEALREHLESIDDVVGVSVTKYVNGADIELSSSATSPIKTIDDVVGVSVTKYVNGADIELSSSATSPIETIDDVVGVSVTKYSSGADIERSSASSPIESIDNALGVSITKYSHGINIELSSSTTSPIESIDDELGASITKYSSGANIEPFPPPPLLHLTEEKAFQPIESIDDALGTSITKYSNGTDIELPFTAAEARLSPLSHQNSDSSTDFTSAKNNLIRELAEGNFFQPKGVDIAQQVNGERAYEDKQGSFDPGSTNPQTPSDAIHSSASPAEERTDDMGTTNFTNNNNIQDMFTYQTIVDSDNDATFNASATPAMTDHSKGSLPQDAPRSPDAIEREYLQFAEGELNSGTGSTSYDNSQIQRQVEETASKAIPEPDYAVIVKRTNTPKAASNGFVRRKSSNLSDTSDVNQELKSSTAYKFNYRAYKKKLSARQDTVTDLFEYHPVN